MGICVGNSFFSTSISNERINEMLTRDSSPHLSIWEIIKEFFCSTGKKEAMECLFKLCNPTPDLTSDEVEAIFYRLKELASPGYKERFCDKHIDSSSTGKLHIKDDNGNDLLYIEINGGLCNYTILGKTFIYDNNLMPGLSREYETNIQELSIKYKNIKSQSFNSNVTWVRNGLFCFSYKNNKLTMNFNDLYKEIESRITSMQKGEDYYSWCEQEKETYLSAVINKEMDNQLINKQSSLLNKNDIFSLVENNLSTYNFRLNSQCARSSIKHCVLASILKKETFCDFLIKASSDRNTKNVITADIVNALSNQIFEDMFMEEMSLPHEWIHIIRSSVSDSIRTYLEDKPVN